MLYNDPVAAITPEVVAWRHTIHAHPELGFQEHRTAALVAEQLRSFGIEVHEGIAGTGVVGVLRKEVAKGRTLALAIHQLVDAERVCDRFVLLADGHVRGVGTLNDLRTLTGIVAGSLEDIFLALT